MKSILLSLLLFVAIFCVGCSEDTKNEKNTSSQNIKSESVPEPKTEVLSYRPSESKPAAEAVAASEAIYDSLLIDGVTGHSYAAYVPESWKQGQSVVFLLDPQGEGWQAVSKYKEIAKSAGIALVGSNNSKNGIQWSEQSLALDLLVNEIRRRFTLDVGKIHMAGFSGGARGGALQARTKGWISSWIGCGAAFDQPGVSLPDSMTACMVVGFSDLNYLEIISEYQRLQGEGKSIGLVSFDGKHEWPDANTMNKVWELTGVSSELEVDAKEKIKIKAPAKGNEYVGRLDWSRNWRSYQQLAPQVDLGEIVTELDEYKNSGQMSSDLEKEAQLLTGEQADRDPLMQNMDTQTLAWWKGEIRDWAKIPQGDRGKRIAYGQRLSFLGLVSFLKADQAIRQNQGSADKYLGIYELAEPGNGEVNFLKAVGAGASGDSNTAFSELENAVAKGFYRADRILSEAAFQSLGAQNPERFKTLLNQANAQKYR